MLQAYQWYQTWETDLWHLQQICSSTSTMQSMQGHLYHYPIQSIFWIVLLVQAWMRHQTFGTPWVERVHLSFLKSTQDIQWYIYEELQLKKLKLPQWWHYHTVKETSCFSKIFGSLVPRCGEGGDRVPGKHCLRMHIIIAKATWQN